MPTLKSAADLEKLRQSILAQRDPNASCVTVCSGTGCHAYGCEEVADAFVREIQRMELDTKVRVLRTGCHGFCERGAVVVILPEEICYLHVKPEDVPEIVSATLMEKNVVDRLVYRDANGEKAVRQSEIPFYKHQSQIIFGDNRLIDPKSMEDYIAIGGYAALAKAVLAMTPVEVLETVKKANLRGRGGGGFPAGRKWETTRNAPGDTKYVIVNADEGDPGAYMDRSLLEGNPHRVIEGLIIGAYAIGCREGFVYVRAEYPLALDNTKLAIKTAREYGLLGKNILGSGFDFDITIHRGAGAFVSGESSALMNAIEGRVGEPRPKYIHTSVSGVWEKPSCLNNVETWANVPFIINKGADWFRSIGTENSKGTKIFSLVGQIQNTGLVEVPMGTSLKTIVYDIGGGARGKKKIKAVQTGGPSGGVLTADMLDVPVDFDKLTEAGSMMGSGGMIVMDEGTCMVDTARYYTEFLARESCGKCVPCREGLRQTLRILNKITMGQGTKEDIDLLEELGAFMQEASLCALGKTAPNPVISTLRCFRDEYIAHTEGRCPAGVCKALIRYYIDQDKCIQCGLCSKNCPVGAVEKIEDAYVINQEKCTKCGVCESACPDKARAVLVGDAVRPEHVESGAVK